MSLTNLLIREIIRNGEKGASLAATVVSTGTANVVDGEVKRRIQGKETKASDVALGTQGTKNPRTIFELNYKGDVKKSCSVCR